MAKINNLQIKKGAQANIYKKYLHYLHDFLQNHAKYDIDGDGKKWCKKEEWVAFLCPLISDDDANAIGYTYCHAKATTAFEMMELVRRGKLYICHRLYNMGFIKNLERRRIGRNVSYFRYLKDGENKTPPIPDSPYILKKVFMENPQTNKLSPDEACNNFLAKLSIAKFPDDDSRVAEWNRVVSLLEKQGCLVFKNGLYEFSRSTVD